MTISYFTCDGCNAEYRDDSDFVCHCDCGSNFCNKDCGKLSNYLDPSDFKNLDEEDPIYQDYIDEDFHIDKDNQITCIICRNKLCINYTIFNSLIKYFNLLKKYIINIYKGKVKL